MPMNNRTLRPKNAAAAAVTYHEEALAWKSAAEANGGTVSTPTLAAVSTFCTAIDAAGIRDRFLRLNLLCGTNLEAAQTPLYRDSSPTGQGYGNAIDQSVGPFASTDYSESTGLNGNGSSKCLDTGLVIGDLYTFGAEYNNVHISVYRRDSTAGGAEFGASYYSIGLDQYVGLYLYYNGTNYQLYAGDAQGDWELTGTPTAYGLYLSQVGSGPAGVMLQNNSNILIGSSFGNAITFQGMTGTLLAMALDYHGTPADFVSGRISAYSTGKAFTSSAQRAAYYNAMLAFQAALGRNV